MIIRYTSRAAADLEAAAAYRVPRSRQSAVKVQAAILSALAAIASFPHSGRLQMQTGVRRTTARHYPYSIYYTVDEDAGIITVLAIQHHARATEFTES